MSRTLRKIPYALRSPREFRRWIALRCEHCGHRFRWKRDHRFATGNRDGKVYHGTCLAYLTWRRKAENRLTVLGLTLDVTGATGNDIQVAAELRESDPDARTAASNRAWRVFYDLSKREAS